MSGGVLCTYYFNLSLFGMETFPAQKVYFYVETLYCEEKTLEVHYFHLQGTEKSKHEGNG